MSLMKNGFSPIVATLAALCASLAGADLPAPPAASAQIQAEVVVYGATPAGVTAAVAAARQGHTVALIDINAHVGGMVSGGLVATDIGDRKTVGGLADDFFQRIVKFYTEKYGADSKELKACRNGLTRSSPARRGNRFRADDQGTAGHHHLAAVPLPFGDHG